MNKFENWIRSVDAGEKKFKQRKAKGLQIIIVPTLWKEGAAKGPSKLRALPILWIVSDSPPGAGFLKDEPV